MIATGKPDLSEGEGFYYKDNVLYRRWERKGRESELEAVYHQLVLPAKCRETALTIAHEIPLGGHLGKTKTAD